MTAVLAWLGLSVVVLLGVLSARADPAQDATDLLPVAQAAERLEQIRDRLGGLAQPRETLRRVAERAFSECVVALAEPELCECLTKRILLELQLLCYSRVIERTTRDIYEAPILVSNGTSSRSIIPPAVPGVTTLLPLAAGNDLRTARGKPAR